MIEAPADSIHEALARLDADIEATEEHLRHLRLMRASIQPFIEQYLGPAHRGVAVSELPSRESDTGEASSFTDSVIDVFRHRENEILDVDSVFDILRGQGLNTTRDQVRNALNYAVRLQKLMRGTKRGHFVLKSTSTPAATGVEVNEEPDLEGSSGEEGGGRDYRSVRLRDRGEGAVYAPLALDRVDDRAPIEG